MVHQQGTGVGQIQKRKTDIKTLKMVYGDVRGSVPYWANEYRDRAALPPLTQILSAKTFRKSRGKDAFRIYSQIGKRRFCKADLNFTEKAFGDKGG